MKMTQKSGELYETDFFRWTVENAALLRARKFDQIDVEHLAGEIEDMGRRDRREVRSRMVNLVAHLLKWQFQPQNRSSNWEVTISRERAEIPLIFEDSPSLRGPAEAALPAVYRRAVERAGREARLPAASLPEVCPYTFEQVLQGSFLPE